MKDNLCVYCGSDAEVRDHVIPVSFLSITRSYNEDENWIVPCCYICNSLAGSEVLFSISEKAEFILSRYLKKYRKIIKSPEWTEDELKSVSYTIREMVWGRITAKRVLLQKIDMLSKTAQLPYDWQRPEFVKRKIYELIKLHKSIIRKKKKRKNDKTNKKPRTE